MAYSDFQLAFQTCPIVLIAGIAGTGVLSIAELLNPESKGSDATQAIAQAIASGQDPGAVQTGVSSSGAFGAFRVLPGGTLIENENAKYPLATMSVAANAIITAPLRVAVEMAAPAGDGVSLSQRLSIFTSLKNTLDNHIAAGGYFNVATPAYIYTDCLLLNLVDASDVPDGAQTQTRWVWNFERPLITLQQAQQVVNTAMGKLSAQTYNAGQPPGSQPLLTSVATPLIGQQITPRTDNPAGVTQLAASAFNIPPVASSIASTLGNYI